MHSAQQRSTTICESTRSRTFFISQFAWLLFSLTPVSFSIDSAIPSMVKRALECLEFCCWSARPLLDLEFARCSEFLSTFQRLKLCPWLLWVSFSTDSILIDLNLFFDFLNRFKNFNRFKNLNRFKIFTTHLRVLKFLNRFRNFWTDSRIFNWFKKCLKRFGNFQTNSRFLQSV